MKTTYLDILLACLFGAALSSGMLLIFILRTGWY